LAQRSQFLASHDRVWLFRLETLQEPGGLGHEPKREPGQRDRGLDPVTRSGFRCLQHGTDGVFGFICQGIVVPYIGLRHPCVDRRRSIVEQIVFQLGS
jgi:hypothetical protein